MIDRDTIIKLAREAGFNWPDIQTTTIEERLERFASLVAAAEREACAEHYLDICRKAIVEEREACAAICDHHDKWGAIPRQAAAAIRARSTQ